VLVCHSAGVLRVVAVGKLVLWEDEVEECGWHFECVWINLSFPYCMCRSTMARVIATEVDVVLMREFLEEARLAFLMVLVGARMEEVNAFFWHWAARARRSVPAGVWVVVWVRGHYRRSVLMQRWTQWQLLVLREATVARCVWIVTGQTVI
jgi:hypothetical protein